MKNQQVLFEFIRQMAGQANVLTIPRLFIDLVDGDLEAAILLGQCLYWSDRGRAGWFYKSYKDCQEETTIPERTARRALQTDLRKANGAPTVHYRVNMDALVSSVEELLEVRSGQKC